MKIYSYLAPLFLLCHNANAQGLSELNQRLGYCDAQTVPSKRATCFEKLARDAIKVMENPAQASQPAAAGAAPPDKANKYADFIAKAKTSLTREFKDPATVQWRGLFIAGEQLPVLCGELNGRNSYGAYVGFRRFYASENTALQDIENKDNRAMIDGMWPTMCGKKIAEIDANGIARVIHQPTPPPPTPPRADLPDTTPQKAQWVTALVKKDRCEGGISVRAAGLDGTKEKFEATCSDKTVSITCDFSRPISDEMNGIPMVRGDAGYIQAACWF